mgnify:CR=1 FL=1
MKKYLSAEYITIRRLRKILRSYVDLNSQAVSVIRYGAGIVDWTREELDVLKEDQKTNDSAWNTPPQGGYR